MTPGVSEEESHGNGHGVEIFDLSDPWNPVFVSRVGFDKVYSRYNDYWTPRPCSDGKYVICADTVNGLYVVDSSTPEKAELISRVRFLTGDGQNIAVNSVAVAKGVVYAATWRDFGLVAFECPEAYPNVREKGDGPKKASYRFPYTTSADSRFNAWKPDGGAPVRSIAARDNLLFAACSFGGLAVLKKSKDGSLTRIDRGRIPFAADVKVRGGRLFVAEGRDGLAVYKIKKNGSLKELARYRDFSLDGPMAYCTWVYVPTDDWALASTRDMGNYYLSMKHFPVLDFAAKIGDNPGWDKYACDAPDSKGMYPAVRPYQGIAWVNLNEIPLKEVIDKGFRPTLFDGVCRFRGDRFITFTKGKMYIYSAAEAGKEKAPVFDAGDTEFRGIPTWDGGDRLALTGRIGKGIRMVDISDERNPRLLWMENTDGYPETAIFWKGKLTVPCGYQGLLVEK